MKLKAENLMKSYKGRKVVKGITVEVNQGEIVGLLGPNGAGKTTSFYMIVGLIKPNGGNIYLEGTEITKYPMYKRAQNGIGYLAQEASVFRKLSVEDNILSVLQLTKLSKKEQRAKMESLIEEFGLGHIRKNRGDLLSGGERRRTEIARALATDPHFILLDEPFAGVDPVAVEDIQRIVARHYNVSKSELLSNRRTRTIVKPRQVAMYLSKVMTPRSLPEIGRRFGGRDHTTVLHAVRKIEDLTTGDQTLAQEIELLKRLINEQA